MDEEVADMHEPLFRVFDLKFNKWAGVRGESGRSFEEYWREKMFRESDLIWCDLEGFVIDQYGGLMLLDECGNSIGLPADRFQVCFSKEVFNSLLDSKSGNYKVYAMDREKIEK